MHRIWFHDSVFLIRPASTHNNTLQVILKISIFRFADPSMGVIDQLELMMWAATFDFTQLFSCCLFCMGHTFFTIWLLLCRLYYTLDWPHQISDLLIVVIVRNACILGQASLQWRCFFNNINYYYMKALTTIKLIISITAILYAITFENWDAYSSSRSTANYV